MTILNFPASSKKFIESLNAGPNLVRKSRAYIPELFVDNREESEGSEFTQK